MFARPQPANRLKTLIQAASLSAPAASNPPIQGGGPETAVVEKQFGQIPPGQVRDAGFGDTSPSRFDHSWEGALPHYPAHVFALYHQISPPFKTVIKQNHHSF